MKNPTHGVVSEATAQQRNSAIVRGNSLAGVVAAASGVEVFPSPLSASAPAFEPAVSNRNPFPPAGELFPARAASPAARGELFVTGDAPLFKWGGRPLRLVTHPSPQVTRPLPLVAHHRSLVTHPFPKGAHPLGRFASPLVAGDAPLATGDAPLAAGDAPFGLPASPHLAENQPFMPKPPDFTARPRLSTKSPHAPCLLEFRGPGNVFRESKFNLVQSGLFFEGAGRPELCGPFPAGQRKQP